MWPYLKAAFWARPQIPGLGRLPLNALVLSGLGLLGFGHQGFWLAGMAVETAYLYALTTNLRFQQLVDAEKMSSESLSGDAQRRALIQTLTPPRRQELAALEGKCARALQLHHDGETDEFTLGSNQEALQKLQWLYLKLLVAQQNLTSLEAPTSGGGLPRQIETLQQDLRSEKLSSSLRESKEATLKILEQRRTNLDRRAQNLEEISSDLTRIEAQVDLAVENAGMRGKTETISTNIDLVSQLLDDSVYGESGPRIAALEQTYGERS